MNIPEAVATIVVHLTDKLGRRPSDGEFQAFLLGAEMYQPEMTEGVALIAAERKRQIEIGWDHEHDKGHHNALAQAGASYALSSIYANGDPESVLGPDDVSWPWDEKYWKPTGDPEQDLIKAGALIAAALDSHLRRNLYE